MSSVRFCRMLTVLCGAALLCCLCAPSVSALFGAKKTVAPAAVATTRSVLNGQVLHFTQADFPTTGGEALESITITALPDSRCGLLCMAGQPVSTGTVIRTDALDGLSFQASPAPTTLSSGFSFRPTFVTGTLGDEITTGLVLLEHENRAPIAENLALTTYKNVSVSAHFQASDIDGDTLTFQLTDTPARGSVTLSEDGTGRFVYTPYENKTGKDTFTFVAVDPAGNISNPAKVTIKIEKQKSGVSYSDMAGNPSHKAAVQLAEEGIFLGAKVNDTFFFHPDSTVSRSEFLSMAMAAAGLKPLEDVSLTGFADDSEIPSWSKGYVSCALMSGAVSGVKDDEGRIVFCPDAPVTRAQAAAILDNLIDVSDVAVQTWSSIGVTEDAGDHWGMQSAVDLACAGILPVEHSTPPALDCALTRAEVAEMLCGSLELLKDRAGSRLF